MKYYFLQHCQEFPEKPERHLSLADAKAAFWLVASERAKEGLLHMATVHKSEYRPEVREHPTYYLELGPRGGVRCTKA